MIQERTVFQQLTELVKMIGDFVWFQSVCATEATAMPSGPPAYPPSITHVDAETYACR